MDIMGRTRLVALAGINAWDGRERKLASSLFPHAAGQSPMAFLRDLSARLVLRDDRFAVSSG
ncbi:hypothetical protein XI03_02580 [Bradyrhizobium sp. CCBAU 65884]|nr:hypothetical protein [Bradyrhizobium sp. CCBAU 65884]